MPAVVNKTVGSFSGITGALLISICPCFFTKKSINKIQINSYWYNVTLQNVLLSDDKNIDEKYLLVTDSTDSNNLRSCFICKTDNIEKFDLYSIKRINSSYSDELKTIPSGLEIPDYLDDDD